MAGTFDISTINVISPNGLVTKPLTVDNYGYAKIGDERVGITPQNWIINGMFDVWQRGTSQTFSGYGSDDRWYNFPYSSTLTHSRQTFVIGQTDVPNNPTYFSRSLVTSANSTSCLVNKFQKIEDVTKLSGKTVALSFWAKADGNKNISIEFAQAFGTGGSTEVNTLGVQKFTLTTSWQKFIKVVNLPSVSSKTIGTGSYTQVAFWFDAGSDYASRTDSLGNQSGTFDIANVCLVEGSVPVECPNEPYGEVLRKCQRYYQRFGGDGVTQVIGSGMATGTTNVVITIKLNSPMRVVASSLEYSTLGCYDSVNAGLAVTNCVLDVARCKEYGVVSCTVSGATQFRIYNLLTNNSLSAYLAFSAEL